MSADDVVMKEVGAAAADDGDDVEAKVKSPEELENLFYAALVSHLVLVQKTTSSKEVRYLHRALRRYYGSLRRKITANLIVRAVTEYVTESDSLKPLLLNLVKPTGKVSTRSNEPKKSPEVSLFLAVITLTYLVDENRLEDAHALSDTLLERVQESNMRTLDPLSAKLFFYYSRSYELSDRLADIRVRLLALLRTATLRHNYEGQIVLLNLLLRNFLHYNLYDQAEKLASKTDFQSQHATSNEAARYHFYMGLIYAVQLKYSESFANLSLALRKGPRVGARGFRLSATKFSVIVQLLLGEIPERSLFNSEGIKTALVPYLHLAKSVRAGSIASYESALVTHGDRFRADRTMSLIARLRHNVIKTGLRKINLAYSRISFADITAKLNLENEGDAEFLVAKAIRDKIIDASIDHENGFVTSSGTLDVYGTNEPENAFRKRIDFLINIHNDAVKAMRYPDKQKVEEEEEEEDNDDVPTIEEAIAELLDGDDDDDM
eukprot:TRINITY_DN2337_c0_g1_i1.p1 TRINITY_DN2337_c0_g1~~TRINITY_DN2337_c0_g1_i1.p1  ORF type:complete len:492 (-),score=125.06 TRINITY_DN2337_c0_g1_i1:121-1596(-)